MAKKLLKSVFWLILIFSVCIFSGCGNTKQEEQKEEISREVYESPLKNYMEGLKNRDINLVLQAFPEFMQTFTQADLDSIYANYEAMYGSNVKMEYNLGDSVKIKEQKDLDILASQIREYYPNAGDIQVTAAYIITVELSVSGDGVDNNQSAEGENKEVVSNKKTDSQDFYVYQYNGNWYMF